MNLYDFNKALVDHGREQLHKMGLADLVRMSTWNKSEALYLLCKHSYRQTGRSTDTQMSKLSFQLGGKGGNLGQMELETITRFHSLRDEDTSRYDLETEKVKLTNNINAVYKSGEELGNFIRSLSHNRPDPAAPADTPPSLGNAKFAAVLEDFCTRFHARCGEPFQDFRTGLPCLNELYKTNVRNLGLERLNLSSWSRGKIGSGHIASCVIDAITINVGKNLRNNMVRWEARWGDAARSHQKLLLARKTGENLKEIETAFFRLYREKDDPRTVFDDLTQLLGRRFDLLAFLFYLRDGTRFLPISVTQFEKAFKTLGMPLRLSINCNWDTYQAYLDRIRLVHDKLRQTLVADCSFIDAHSFCWMLVNLPSVAQSDAHQAPKYLHAVPSAVPPGKRSETPKAPFEKSPEDFLADQLNRNRIGNNAERIVLDTEIARLQNSSNPDLAERVRNVSNQIGLGYDIESFTNDGRPKRIEVKAASVRSSRWSFFLSENERVKSQQIEGYVFALVTDLDANPPTIWEFPGTGLAPASLVPVTYHATVTPGRPSQS